MKLFKDYVPYEESVPTMTPGEYTKWYKEDSL